jgi:DNA (cytosine-5)-methyltransferase 1
MIRALDLFCGAGGASAGLSMAGFDVTGVDINPQPNYPGKFIQSDAMTFDLFDYDFIWASPPCQAYSDLAKRNGNAHEWPQLIGPIRQRLWKRGAPFVIENVEGAPLINPVRLCGTQFKSLRVLRHRLFEASFQINNLPHGKHPKCHTHDKRKAHFGKTCEWKDFVQVTGGGNSSVAAAANAMGIWWMTKEELNEAIPPAYAYHVARCFLASIATPAWITGARPPAKYAAHAKYCLLRKRGDHCTCSQSQSKGVE